MLGGAVRRHPQADGHMVRHVALAAGIDAIQKLVEPLAVQFGHGIAHRPAHQVAPARQPRIGQVDELVDVVRSGEKCDEAGRVLEQPPPPFGGLGLTAPRQHLAGGLYADAEQPGDRAILAAPDHEFLAAQFDRGDVANH